MTSPNSLTAFMSKISGVDCTDIQVSEQRQLIFDMIENNPIDKRFTIKEIKKAFSGFDQNYYPNISKNITKIIDIYYEMVATDSDEILHCCAEDLHRLREVFHAETDGDISISDILEQVVPLKKSEAISMRIRLKNEVSKLNKQIAGLESQIFDVENNGYVN